MTRTEIGILFLCGLAVSLALSTFLFPNKEPQQPSQTQHQATSPSTTAQPLKAKEPKIELRNYEVKDIDEYRFTVNYDVVNVGDGIARDIVIRVRPWKEGFFRDDDIRIPDNDPRVRLGKEDKIRELKPGESLSRSIELYHIDGLLPRRSSPPLFPVLFSRDEKQ